MLELIRQIRWQDALDVGIITFLVYRALQIVRGSRAMQMIIGLAVILVAYVSSRALGLFTLNWILDNFLGSIILVIIVIFQSDIRRALTQVGSARRCLPVVIAPYSGARTFSKRSYKRQCPWPRNGSAASSSYSER